MNQYPVCKKFVLLRYRQIINLFFRARKRNALHTTYCKKSFLRICLPETPFRNAGRYG